MRLQEIMKTGVVTIGPDDAAEDAWSRMERRRIRHLVVTEGEDLLGLLSERDLGSREGAAVRRGRTVRELMTSQVASAKPTTTLRQAANMMRGRLIGALPVLEDGRLVGIVTATDVLDELGRGSSRPTVRAQRQSMRVAPASARAAARRAGAAKRGQRVARQGRKGTKAARESADGAGGEGPAPGPGTIAQRMTPTPGRQRGRRPDSSTRAPLPSHVPRPAKRAAGRTAAALTPAYIWTSGSVLDAAGRDYLRRKLGRKLGRFAPSIERTSVRIEDVNGPRGGTDKRCRIKVVLSGLPSVVVEERHHELQAAMDRALARVERAVRTALQRRRMEPLRSHRRAEHAPAFR